MYPIRLKLDEIKISQSDVYKQLTEIGILVNLHYIPVYRHPYYQKNGFDFNDFPESESYYSEAITLPLYPTMLNKEQDSVIKALDESL